MNYYTGEVQALIKEHGWVKAAAILAERKKAEREAQETQGEASELTPEEFQAAIAANRRKS